MFGTVPSSLLGTFPVLKTFLSRTKKAAQEEAAVAVKQAAKAVANTTAKKGAATQADSKQKTNKVERADLSKWAKAEAAVQITRPNHLTVSS